jgi:hypothetical protein
MTKINRVRSRLINQYDFKLVMLMSYKWFKVNLNRGLISLEPERVIPPMARSEMDNKQVDVRVPTHKKHTF